MYYHSIKFNFPPGASKGAQTKGVWGWGSGSVQNYTNWYFWASTKLNGNVGDNPTLKKQIAFGIINKVSTMSAVCQLIKS